MDANTAPLVNLTRTTATVPMASILTAVEDAAKSLPNGVHFAASVEKLGDTPQAQAVIVIRVSDHVAAGAQWTRTYRADGTPRDDWSVGVQGSVTF